MIDPLQAAFSIAASGMSANSARLRVTSENIANAQSTGQTRFIKPAPWTARFTCSWRELNCRE